MANPLIKAVVRSRFRLTSAKIVDKQIRQALARYLELAEGMNELSGSKAVTVPPMIGVDEDMRGWSFFSLLEHNAIVNRAISSNIRRLALNEPESEVKFDPKRDVMPDSYSGIEQVEAFKISVLSHLEMLAELGDLKGFRDVDHPIKGKRRVKQNETQDHPLFGSFNAHMWNCMFAFHLQIHLRQAAMIRRLALASSN